MTTQEITIKPFLSDNNTFKFKPFKSALVNQLDVYYKNKRVAIIEGIDGALLRWICGSDDITIKNIDKLEKMVDKAFAKATKHLLS
jgi:hypothetical protein